MSIDSVKDDASCALGEESILTRLVIKYGVSHARARQMCWKSLAGGPGWASQNGPNWVVPGAAAATTRTNSAKYSTSGTASAVEDEMDTNGEGEPEGESPGQGHGMGHGQAHGEGENIQGGVEDSAQTPRREDFDHGQGGDGGASDAFFIGDG
jgi:hypothetical protein